MVAHNDFYLGLVARSDFKCRALTRNGPQLIGVAALGTGGILMAMSLIATTTKRDFSFMGKALFVGMIVVFLLMIGNMFFQIPALAMAISAMIIVVFSLFILHDVSRIVNGARPTT